MLGTMTFKVNVGLMGCTQDVADILKDEGAGFFLRDVLHAARSNAPFVSVAAIAPGS